jgi:FAD/FMN-containing dehydrogenase
MAAALGRWVPSGSVVTGEAAETWRVGGRRPDAVVFPTSGDQVAAVVAAAADEGWRVVPAGGGGWLDGASAPGTAGLTLVLSTRRMDRILDYEPADLTLTAEAGATLATIRSAAARHGQWLPLDAPPDDEGTIGATLATASSGPLAAAFGEPRDLALGLGVVTGSGQALSPGGRVVKNVAGFDLVRLMVGGWGVLGVVTEATLRLFPRPERDVTLLLRCRDGQKAARAARRVALGTLTVPALELADPSPTGDADAIVSCRVLGSSSEVEAMAASVEATDPDRGWQRLPAEEAAEVRSALRAVDTRGQVVLRLTLLPALLGRALALVGELAGRLGLEGAGAVETVADVTTGRVRVVLRSGSSGRHVDLAEAIRDLRDVVEGEGGSLTLTRAPAALFADVGRWGPPGSVGRLIDDVRSAFDPDGLLPWERFSAEGRR